MSLTKLSLAGNNLSFPGQREFGKWHPALQLEGSWEFNINVGFPFIYYQKWNSYFQNRIIMFCLPVPTTYICKKFIYFQDRSAYSAAGKYVNRSWECINGSQTHECGNWDWGRVIPRKGIHKWNFPCSAAGEGKIINLFYSVEGLPVVPSQDSKSGQQDSNLGSAG